MRGEPHDVLTCRTTARVAQRRMFGYHRGQSTPCSTTSPTATRSCGESVPTSPTASSSSKASWYGTRTSSTCFARRSSPPSRRPSTSRTRGGPRPRRSSRKPAPRPATSLAVRVRSERRSCSTPPHSPAAPRRSRRCGRGAQRRSGRRLPVVEVDEEAAVGERRSYLYWLRDGDRQYTPEVAGRPGSGGGSRGGGLEGGWGCA